MLHELQSAPGIGVSDLAHRLSIHQTTCSQLVEKLVSRGYVEKTRSEEDQRRVGLRITRSAAKVLKDAPGPAEGLLPQALMRLTDATLQSLTTQLGKLIDGVQLQDEQAADKPLADLPIGILPSLQPHEGKHGQAIFACLFGAHRHHW